MRAKGVEFDVTYINLREKPDWFLKISPHGKVPVLSVDGQPLFESNAIAEFLDETVPPRLHPDDPLKRARNRAWTDFVPTFAAAITAITYAKSAEDVAAGAEKAKAVFARVEAALATERGEPGPYFNGPHLSLVDAAYAPFLQRLDIVEKTLKTGLLEEFPLIAAWSSALLADPAVTGALAPEFPEEYAANHKRRGTYYAELTA